jgi:hypothetical protein
MRNTNYFDGQAPVQLKPAAVAEFAVNVGCNGTDAWPPGPRGDQVAVTLWWPRLRRPP